MLRLAVSAPRISAPARSLLPSARRGFASKGRILFFRVEYDHEILTFSPVPDGFKYTKSHEWLKVSGTTGAVGITDYAQSAVRFRRVIFGKTLFLP